MDEITTNFDKKIVRFPDEVKIGDYMFFPSYGTCINSFDSNQKRVFCKVIKCEQTKERRSRENGYKYIFTGENDGKLYYLHELSSIHCRILKFIPKEI